MPTSSVSAKVAISAAMVADSVHRDMDNVVFDPGEFLAAKRTRGCESRSNNTIVAFYNYRLSFAFEFSFVMF